MPDVRAAQKLVTGIKGNIRTLLEEYFEIIFRSCIDDHGNTLGMGDFHEFLEVQQTVIDNMMRNDINGCGRLFGDRMLHVETVGRGSLSDQHRFAAGKADRLIDWRTIAYDMPHLHENFVFLGSAIRQLLDGQQVVAGNGARNGERNTRRAGSRDKSCLAARKQGDNGARLALQIVDFNELRQDRRHGGNCFRNHDRRAEACHGAGHIDHRAKSN